MKSAAPDPPDLAVRPIRAKGDDDERGALIAPKLARAIVAVVFCAFALVALLFVEHSGKGTGEIALAVGYLAGLLGLQYFYFGRPSTDLQSPRTYAVLAVQAGLAYLPLLQFEQSWIGMPGFLAGSVLLVLPPAVAWTGFAAIVASGTAIQMAIDNQPLNVAYVTLGNAVVGLYVYGLTRLARLITELHRARDDLAATAVAHERLQFARDLHDLLGLRLSAIAPKGELTLRLLQRNPDRARRELSEILDISRRALSDVRSVSRVYREASLDEETRTLESMLAASNVDLRMELEHRRLPAPVRTLLARALREGVTNVLRHSEAEHCEITLRQGNDSVCLDVVNDGVPGGHEPRDDGGIAKVSAEVSRMGGELTAGLDPDGRYRLHLTVPVSSPAVDGADPMDEAERSVPRIAAKLAGALAVAVLCGLFAQAMVRLVGDVGDFWPVVGGTGFLLSILALQLAYFSRPDVRLRPPLSYLLLGVQALLVYLPLLLFREPWTGLPGFLAGSALLVFRPLAGWAVFVTVVATVAWAQVAFGATLPRDIGFNILLTVNNGLVTYGLTWMARSVRQLRATRRELADVAVAGERLRFARDLHDLLGLSLSAITLKSELAHRLMTAAPAKAKTELAEVLAISRHALADVRSVASGYHELSLDEEARTAESLLAAADIKVAMDLEYGDLPVEVRTVLATVLREGVTNVLRHSKGEHCEIAVRQRDDLVLLDILNDGVPEQQERKDRGSGIRNLSDRVSRLGGMLTAAPETDGRFRLRAWVPT